MLRSVEVICEGNLHPEVLTYLARDIGVLAPQGRSLILRTSTARGAQAFGGLTALVPGVRHALVRAGSQSHALSACGTDN